MGNLNIINFSCDWNEEVVAQFYATLYVDDKRNVMHFTLGGKRFSIKMYEFASLFRLSGVKEIIYQGVASWKLIVILFVYTMAMNLK
jgi:hypothetical protein